MDYVAELKALCALPGPAAYEKPVAQAVEQLFGRYSPEVWRDDFHNVYARLGEGGPKIMLVAHMDEVALMVRTIQEDGYLGLTRIGGVDPRILPAHEVIVHGREPYFGVIGARPPHVTLPADREKVLGWDDLFCDLGMSPERVRENVKVGDIITFRSPVIALKNGTVAGHALDDRICVLILASAMEMLAKTRLGCEVLFVGSASEEVAVDGAAMAAFDQRPDLAIAVDVTHGDTPDAPAFSTNPMDRPAIGLGPIAHKGWTARLRKAAEALDMAYSLDVFEDLSYTDADPMQLVAEGIPVALLSMPLRYMHTTVETVQIATVDKCARLLARFLQDAAEEGLQ